jgi:hypothetical protein
MEFLEDEAEGRCALLGVGDEVIMVGENRPRLQLPAVRVRPIEQFGMEVVQASRAGKVMDALVRPRSHEVRSMGAEPVGRRVGPIEMDIALRIRVARGRAVGGLEPFQ